jgi:MHS family proline/betaine transporter-like MFS transporter
MGHIGDCFGRRAALTFSVAAMAISTFPIGLLPGYRTIGVLAPVGLTLLRVMQGLSVGGEYTGSMVFLAEHAPEGRRGLMGALGVSGATAGILLGSAVGAAFASSNGTSCLPPGAQRKCGLDPGAQASDAHEARIARFSLSVRSGS